MKDEREAPLHPSSFRVRLPSRSGYCLFEYEVCLLRECLFRLRRASLHARGDDKREGRAAYGRVSHLTCAPSDNLDAPLRVARASPRLSLALAPSKRTANSAKA